MQRYVNAISGKIESTVQRGDKNQEHAGLAYNPQAVKRSKFSDI